MAGSKIIRIAVHSSRTNLHYYFKHRRDDVWNINGNSLGLVEPHQKYAFILCSNLYS